MNDSRFQHLAGAFNSIIAMMLASIRARGLRGLIDLPKTILLGLYLRRLGKEFAALIASLDAGTLLPPAPCPAPPAPQAACAQSAEPVAAFPARQRPAVPPAAPAKAARARATEAASPAVRPMFAAAKTIPRRTSKTPRRPIFARPRRTPDPRAVVRLPNTGRTS
jgi:hypothetical protein